MQRYLDQTPQEDAGTYARLAQVAGYPLQDQRRSTIHCMLAQDKNQQLNTSCIEAYSSVNSPHLGTGCFFTSSSTLSWAYHFSFGHFELRVYIHAAHKNSISPVDRSHLKSSEALYTKQSWRICSVELFGVDVLERWLHHINLPSEQFATPCDPQTGLEQQEQEHSTISDNSSSSSYPSLGEIFSLKNSSNTETNSAAIPDDEEAVLHNAMVEQASNSDLVNEFARLTMSWLIASTANRRASTSSDPPDEEAHAYEG